MFLCNVKKITSCHFFSRLKIFVQDSVRRANKSKSRSVQKKLGGLNVWMKFKKTLKKHLNERHKDRMWAKVSINLENSMAISSLVKHRLCRKITFVFNPKHSNENCFLKNINYSAALTPMFISWLRQLSSSFVIGVKSLWAIHSSRLKFWIWLSTWHKER